MTDAEGFVTGYAYDPAHNLATLTNANGKIWTFAYDAINRRVSQTDPLGGVASYAYDALGQQVRITDENGVVTRSDYDGLGRMVVEVRNEKPGQPADQQTNVTFTYTYDPVGNRTAQIDAEGNQSSYVYDLLDRLTRQTDAENQVTSYLYDAVGNLTKLTNPRGFHTSFGYNGDDQLVSVTDALSQVWSFQYDAAHNRTDVIDPHGLVTHSEYDKLNRLTAQTQNYRAGVTPNSETNVTTGYTYYADSDVASMTDPNGNVTLYRYDGVHRLTEEEDAQGGITRSVYDGVGNRLSVVDANNHTTIYTYDSLNRQIGMIDSEGHAQSYVYDAVGNPTAFTNARTFQTTTQYDPLRRPVKVIDAKNGEISALYDAMGNLLTLTDQNGHPQGFTYDKVYRALSHTDAEGYITAFAYDENGNRISLTDGNGHVTTFAFDALDRMSSTTNAEGEVTSFGYNALGNHTHMTENDGVVTLYDYDPIYRLASVTLNSILAALPNHETNVLFDYSYDPNGNLLAISDPLVHLTHFAYDSLDRLVQETNPLGNAWHYTYDPVDNLIGRLDANGDLTQYTYTADDLLQRISYPDSTSVEYTYDANHNRTRMVDSIGTATWSYDELDRMTATTDSLGRVLAYALDPVGNRTAITYADGRTVDYSYLDNDWLNAVTDPEGGVTNYTRDGVGLATLTVNPNDTVAEMSYDKANRMVSLVNRQVVGAKKTISAFQYSLDAVGQREQTVAEYGWRNPPTVTYDYQYDPLRRLIRTDESDKKETIWTEYDFDAAGNRTGLRTNDDAFSPKPFDSQELTYTFNDANQLLTILGDTHPGQGPAQKTAEKVAQALQAFRHEVAAQQGKHISETAADALLAQADALVGQLYASKPPKQNVVSAAITALRDAVTASRISGDIDSDGLENSLLVKLDKAISANGGAPGDLQTETFTYDAKGNRINNQFPGPQGPQIQGTDYTYDYENRLTQALNYQMNNQGKRVDRAVTDMGYDGIGRRLAMTYDPKTDSSGAKRTEYVFDGLDPVAEYDLQNRQRRNFYRGDLNRMLSMHSFPSSQMSWYAYDGLGSVTGLTKDKGQSVHNYRYDVYGSVIPVNGNWTEPHNSYTYTGQEWVESLNLLHFYARDYDPVAGVWMQQDVYRGRLMEPVTLHRYGYVGGNPVNRFDLYGYSYNQYACVNDGRPVCEVVPEPSGCGVNQSCIGTYRQTSTTTTSSARSVMSKNESIIVSNSPNGSSRYPTNGKISSLPRDSMTGCGVNRSCDKLFTPSIRYVYDEIERRKLELRENNLKADDTSVYDAYTAIPTVLNHRKIITDTARIYSIPPELLATVIAAEMDFDHDSGDKITDALGRKGINLGAARAVGVASVHPDTLDDAIDYLSPPDSCSYYFGYDRSVTNCASLEGSIEGAAIVIQALVQYKGGVTSTQDKAVIFGAYRSGVTDFLGGGGGFSSQENFANNVASGTGELPDYLKVGKNSYMAEPYVEFFEQVWYSQ